MRFFVVCLTWLSIFVPSSGSTQNTVPAGKLESTTESTEPPDLQQLKPLQEQPNTLPVDKMIGPGSISTGDIESNDARRRTPDDVILFRPQLH